MCVCVCVFLPQVDPETLVDYMMAGGPAQAASFAEVIQAGLLPESVKLLNLAADWVRSLLPHCLGKINRVGYGVLTELDLAGLDPNMPASRKVRGFCVPPNLMAVCPPGDSGVGVGFRCCWCCCWFFVDDRLVFCVIEFAFRCVRVCVGL